MIDICITEDMAKMLSDGIEEAFQSMLEKRKRSVRHGLRVVASDTLTFLNGMEATCSFIKNSVGAKRLRSGCSRLSVLATAKTLVDFGIHVEYEAMKVLRVGGIDVHREVNLFVGRWLSNETGELLGRAMADFFEDFKEEDEIEEIAIEDRDPMFIMITDAINAAHVVEEEELKFGTSCFDKERMRVFEQSIEKSLDSMLERTKRTMQVGLKGIADAVSLLFSEVPSKCVSSQGAQTIWKGAKKLGKLTRRTVVDYGTFIKYEALSSLVVGGLNVHQEVNNFITAWRLHTHKQSGESFAKLMQKFSKMSGHDEL